MNSLLLATRSSHKAAEIGAILAPVGLGVESLADLDVPIDPEEEGVEAFETFRENAAAKARYFAHRVGRPAVADDSGLRVDALDGRPGVRTKRFSGRTDLEGQALDEANNALLLERLEGVAEEGRGARYVCCAALAWPDGRVIATAGTVRGRIARAPRGTAGFGYDPLFWLPGLGATFAEVSAGVKNGISHRARAFRALASALGAVPWSLAG